ncbi:MAG: RluA family pseudouridine synthase [Bdellovibrionota bacterium]
MHPKLLQKTPRWLVLDKPAGWLTVPGRELPGVPILSEWARENHGPVWVVHRLDRETSGVILLALSAEAHHEANDWFSSHEVRKFYDCLAIGRAEAPMFVVKEPVGGQSASSQIEVRETFGPAFLARVRPTTGRRHQIRIHLAARGHPLLGDPTYGGTRELRLRGGESMSIPRVALHASRLELPGGEKFEAPWAEDFQAWVARLRQEGTESDGT